MCVFAPPATRPGLADTDYGCVVCYLHEFLTIEGHWKSLEVKKGKELFKNHIAHPKGGWCQPGV